MPYGYIQLMAVSKIRQIAEQLQKETKQKVAAKVLEILRQDVELLIQLNRQQLFESKDALNRPLGNYKNPRYASKKGRSSIDLRLTSSFYHGFFIRTDDFPVVFDSSDEKTAFLVKKFSKEIFGLSKESLTVYINTSFKKRFADYYREILHIR